MLPAASPWASVFFQLSILMPKDSQPNQTQTNKERKDRRQSAYHANLIRT